MQRSNVIALGGVLNDVAKDRSVRFTHTASQMLYSMVDAIVADPHPSWRGQVDFDGNALDGFQRNMIDKLRDKLMAMPLPPKAEWITTFDLLHAISDIVDALCPFQKVPP
jgi:hypothetical protein